MDAAFVTLFHAWLFAVVEALGFPSGFCNSVDMLYSLSATSLSAYAGHVVFLFCNLCELVQGSPLSGTLYAAALALRARALERTDKKTGVLTRMRADDVGLVPDHLQVLVDYKCVFDVRGRLAGQCLKPIKTFIIPPAFELWESVHAKFITWIACHIPDWANVQVVAHGVYIGIALGPDAG